MTTIDILRKMRAETDLPRRGEIRSISLKKFAELAGLSIEQVVKVVRDAKQNTS